METFTPIVITSRAAKKDFSDIRFKHSKLLNDMQNQALKVEVYNQKKDIENRENMMMQNEQNVQMRQEQMDREKMQSDSQRASMEMNIKSKELAVKQAALQSDGI